MNASSSPRRQTARPTGFRSCPVRGNSGAARNLRPGGRSGSALSSARPVTHSGAPRATLMPRTSRSEDPIPKNKIRRRPRMNKPYRSCSCRAPATTGPDGKRRPGKLLGSRCPDLARRAMAPGTPGTRRRRGRTASAASRGSARSRPRRRPRPRWWRHSARWQAGTHADRPEHQARRVPGPLADLAGAGAEAQNAGVLPRGVRPLLEASARARAAGRPPREPHPRRARRDAQAEHAGRGRGPAQSCCGGSPLPVPPCRTCQGGGSALRHCRRRGSSGSQRRW